jgi:hypothetical protein
MRALEDEWKNISKGLCLRTLRLKKGRVQKMLDNHGHQIENSK